MSLPVTIQYGYVAIYGLGSAESVTGIVPTDNIWVFGNVEQVSQYGINEQLAGSYVGCHVMFRQRDAQLAIQYNNWPYTIISQDKLAGLSEQDAPPAL